MNQNEKIIHQFYTAFQNKDFITMQNCYDNNAIFNDEVFTNLTAHEVRKMWEMFCVNSNANIEFDNVWADDVKGKAHWVATYTFSKTGNKVVNKITSNFTFKDGKIIAQKDEFDFYKWSSQALGLTGKLLGWTNFLKNKVQQSAMETLNKFINKQQ